MAGPSELEQQLIYHWVGLVYHPTVKNQLKYWHQDILNAKTDAQRQRLNERIMISLDDLKRFRFHYLPDGFLDVHRQLVSTLEQGPTLADRVQVLCPNLWRFIKIVTNHSLLGSHFHRDAWRALCGDNSMQEAEAALLSVTPRLSAETLLAVYVMQSKLNKPLYRKAKEFRDEDSSRHHSHLIRLVRDHAHNGERIGPKAPHESVLKRGTFMPALTHLGVERFLETQIKFAREDTIQFASEGARGEQETLVEYRLLLKGLAIMLDAELPDRRRDRLSREFDRALKRLPLTSDVQTAKALWLDMLCGRTEQLRQATRQQLQTRLEALNADSTSEEPRAWICAPLFPWPDALSWNMSRQAALQLAELTGATVADLMASMKGLEGAQGNSQMRSTSALDTGLFYFLLELAKQSPGNDHKDASRLIPALIQHARTQLDQADEMFNRYLKVHPSKETPAGIPNELNALYIRTKSLVFNCWFLARLIQKIRQHPTTEKRVSEWLGFRDQGWAEEVAALLEEANAFMMSAQQVGSAIIKGHPVRVELNEGRRLTSAYLRESTPVLDRIRGQYEERALRGQGRATGKRRAQPDARELEGDLDNVL